MAGKRMLVAGVILAGALAAGGAAYTNSTTQPASQVLGYGTTTVSGATVSSIAYNLSADGSNVDTVTLALAGDTTASAVSIAFNSGASTSCGTGTYDGTSSTTYTCSNGGANFSEPTSGLTATHVIVN